MNAVPLLALLLLLGGCASMQNSPESTEQEIGALLAAEQYGEALSLIDLRIEADPAEPRWQEQRDRVLDQADEFELDRLRAARELSFSERWQDVETLYDEALQLYPQSRRLQTARNDFLGRRREEIEDISLRLLLLRGDWLVRSAPLYAQIESQGAIADWRDSLQSFHNTRRETAAGLHRCGQKALQQKNFALATECLALSAKLDPNDAVRVALDAASQQHEGERSRDAAKRQQRQQEDSARRNAELAEECRAALDQDNLARASQCLREFDRIAPFSAEIAELRPLIDTAVERHVRHGIELGQQRYSNGQIEQALTIWEPLLELRPENLELQTHVERARRVLRKLKQLGG